MNIDKDLKLGARLKKERLEKNLTLEQVNKKTKIPLKILEAIEEDRLININPVYIRGLLKIYCSLLGLDPQEYIQHYQQPPTLKDQPDKEKPLLSQPEVKVSLFKGPHMKLKIILTITLFFILSFGIFKLMNIKRYSTSLERKKTPQVQAPKPVSPSTLIKVGIRAKEDCWIRASVDGKVLFQNILKKGRFETWQAKDKIELTLGNAGGIDLEVNGRLFSPLGRKGQVIKRILINKEGLQVLK